MAGTPDIELNGLLPWHAEAWARVARMRSGGRLPHALLLAGRPGMGKLHFAQSLGRALLCREADADGQPCGACATCTLLRVGNHPDLRLVRLEVNEKTGKPRSEITIDQVRALVDYLTLKSHYDGYKVVIVDGADQLNRNAANALLKTLEEPSAGTLLILVSARPARLPRTILSRCQQLLFQPRPADAPAATGWLREQLPADRQADVELLLSLAGGAPLAALALAGEGAGDQRRAMLDDLVTLAGGTGDPVAIAEQWLKFGLRESLYWLYVWLADMARLKVADQPPCVMNPDQQTRLATMAARVDSRRLLEQLDRVQEALRAADGQASPQLLLEDSLLGWASINLTRQ